MSNRRNRVLPMPAIKTPEHKLSDKTARVWESYQRPMSGAIQALNAAIMNTQNVLGAIVLEMEGFSVDTHMFDVDRMVIIERPVPPSQEE